MVPTVKRGGGVMVYGCFPSNTVGELLKIDDTLNQHGHHSIPQRCFFSTGHWFQTHLQAVYMTEKESDGVVHQITWPPQTRSRWFGLRWTTEGRANKKKVVFNLNFLYLGSYETALKGIITICHYMYVICLIKCLTVCCIVKRIKQAIFHGCQYIGDLFTHVHFTCEWFECHGWCVGMLHIADRKCSCFILVLQWHYIILVYCKHNLLHASEILQVELCKTIDMIGQIQNNKWKVISQKWKYSS